MHRTGWAICAAVLLLCGCGTGRLLPWGAPEAAAVPRVPPGATAYECEGGKSLFVRFEREAKAAWIIHSAGEYRLDSIASSAGEQYGKGRTLLTVRDGVAELQEGGKTELAACKVKALSGK